MESTKLIYSFILNIDAAFSWSFLEESICFFYKQPTKDCVFWRASRNFLLPPISLFFIGAWFVLVWNMLLTSDIAPFDISPWNDGILSLFNCSALHLSLNIADWQPVTLFFLSYLLHRTRSFLPLKYSITSYLRRSRVTCISIQFYPFSVQLSFINAPLVLSLQHSIFFLYFSFFILPMQIFKHHISNHVRL